MTRWIWTIILASSLTMLPMLWAQPVSEEVTELPRQSVDDTQQPLRFGGRMETEYSEPEPHRVVSERYIEFVVLNQGETDKQIDLALEDCKEAYVAVWPLHAASRGEDFEFILDTSQQRGIRAEATGRLDSPEFAGLPPVYKAYKIQSAQRGVYPAQLKVSGSRGARQVYGVVANQEKSELTLTVHLSHDQAFTGTPLSFFAALKYQGQPVTNATVVAQICKEGSGQLTDISLLDDGQKQDSHAADGIYTAQAIVGSEIAREPGPWFIRFHASGNVPGSQHRFQRTASLYFHHAAAAGVIMNPVREYQLNRGKTDQLIFKVPVQIQSPGKYRLTGMLIGKKENKLRSIAWSMETRQIADVGEHHYFLTFHGADIQAAGMAGPYRLDMELFSLDRLELAARSRRHYWTLPYSLNTFPQPTSNDSQK